MSWAHANKSIDEVCEQARKTAYLDGKFSFEPSNHPHHFELYTNLIKQLDEDDLKNHPSLIMRKLLCIKKLEPNVLDPIIKEINFILQYADKQSPLSRWAEAQMSILKKLEIFYKNFEKTLSKYSGRTLTEFEQELMQKEFLKLLGEFKDDYLRERWQLKGSKATGKTLLEEILHKCAASKEMKEDLLQWGVYLTCRDPNVVLENLKLDTKDLWIDDVGNLVFSYTYSVPNPQKQSSLMTIVCRDEF